ncbi:MAG: putative pyridoxal-dependent aspartate 1-decarboxylase [Planctomycetota bacterium]|nr:putative pyridoxal-dependent aspartate 1-decarboxylase [Planctomycetota bacterium]
MSTPPAEWTSLFDTASSAEAERRLDALVGEVVRGFLDQRAIHPPQPPEAQSAPFGAVAIPVSPQDPDRYLDELRERVVKHSTQVSSPHFVGHMTTALPYFMRSLSRLLVAMNQNPVKVETADAVTPLERHVLGAFHRLVYAQDDRFYARHAQAAESTLGMVASGGTVANLTALWVARNRRLGPDGDFSGVLAAGLPAALRHYGFEEAVVVGSTLMHYSLEKAADVLGIGRANLVKVELDSRHRIRTDRLRETLVRLRERKRCVLALVGIAGTTDSGAVDPLDEMADLAREHGIHFHVDAAWGGPTLFSERHARLLRGIERSDSATFDGHKQLYCPMGVGLALFRDPGAAATIEARAEYIIRTNSLDLGRRALEGSRPAMALYLHAALHLLGRQGLGWLIDEGLRKTRHFAERIKARPEFELLCDPQLDVLLYRYVPKPFRAGARQGALDAAQQNAIGEVNRRIQERQTRAGRSFISRTSLDPARFGTAAPIVALRAVLANPLTTEVDLDAVLDEQAALGAAERA